MGLLLSRVGSDPYYASYERSLESLKTTLDNRQVRLAARQKNLAAAEGSIFMYGLAGFVIAALLAAWALNQPPGVLTEFQHFSSVLPLFVEPVVAYSVYVLWKTTSSLLSKRDKRELAAAEAKLRKMITELKDATHYQRTLTILNKYDPDFVMPTPSPAATQEPRTPVGLPLKSYRSADSATRDTPRRVQSALGRVTHAGVSIMPTLDKIANSLIGDNPALTQMLREAKAEAEALRQRLAASEARAAQLASQNTALRTRLGESEEVEPAPSDLAEAKLGPQQMLSRLSLASSPPAAACEPGANEELLIPCERQMSASAPVTPVSTRPVAEFTGAESLAARMARASEDAGPDLGEDDNEFTLVSADTPQDRQGSAPLTSQSPE